MLEFLLDVLPESALACRQLYDVPTGGYHLPLREENVGLRLADVETCRQQWPQVVFDCVEVPVADLLYSLVVNTRSRWILETGTSRGFSTSHLAAGARFVGGDSARVLTIDLAPTPNPFFAGSALGEAITTLHADALAIDLQPLLRGEATFDFMFFDSLHTYAHLSGELVRFLPHLRAGGLFALHDTMVYDDLGLVVAWLAASGFVETVSLPTHRTHGERSRSPGVTLFRKLRRIEAGDLTFPDLSTVVDGERQSLRKPAQVVHRTGGLFLDARYVVGGLHRDGPRDDTSPSLLEAAEARRERPSSGDWLQRLGPFVRAQEPPAGAALARHPSVDRRLAAAQGAWWRQYGPLERRFERWLPAPFARATQRDVIARVVDCCARGSAVVELVLAPGPSGLQAAIEAAAGTARTVVRQWPVAGAEPLPGAEAYLVHNVLNHLSAAEIAAVIGRLREAAPPGARIVVLEPVCFPDHRPDAEAAALVRSMEALARTALPDGAALSEHTRETHGLLAKRWWGELPCGPAPMQRPFVGDELARRLAADFDVEGHAIVQAVIAQEPVKRLALLADDAPQLAERRASEMVPALDALEAALLAREPLPDVSWYLALTVAVARAGRR